MRRRGERGMSAFKAGAIAIALIVVASFLVFSRDIPFTRSYELKVVFANAQNLRPKDKVREAGVDVGRVKRIEAYKDRNGDATGAAVVTMQFQKKGLPIHRDATLKIRPRIFLEGSFFVDLQPGSSSAAALHSGDTIPMTHTSASVQIEQVLSSLQAGTRQNLQKLLQGYGDALNGKPLPGEDRDQDKDVKGKTAAQALNKSLDYSAQALRGTALVNDALLGSQPHDLSKLVAGTQKVAAALNSNEGTLQDFVTNFNRTTAAFAARQQDLRQTIHLLPGVLENGSRAFGSLNASFPPTRAFAREILPGVRETGPTIDASFPWVRQVRKLVSPAELQGLVHELRPAVRDLAAVTDETVKFLPQVDLVDRCAYDVILPTGDVVLNDGALSTGLPNYKEFWQSMVGLSSESQNFDGNGQYTRFQTGGGDQTVATGNTPSGPLLGNAPAKPIGSQPKFPGKEPPYNRSVPCYRNQLPNLNNAPIGGGP